MRVNFFNDAIFLIIILFYYIFFLSSNTHWLIEWLVFMVYQPLCDIQCILFKSLSLSLSLYIYIYMCVWGGWFVKK